MEDKRLSIAKEILKKTIYYELCGMDLNEDGCAVLINSYKYMDEHPGSDKIGHIYDYDHLFSQLLRGLKEGRGVVATYQDKGESEFPLDVELV